MAAALTDSVSFATIHDESKRDFYSASEKLFEILFSTNSGHVSMPKEYKGEAKKRRTQAAARYITQQNWWE